MADKVTSEGRVILPQANRNRLGKHVRGPLAYELGENSRRVRTTEPLDLTWHGAISRTLAAEWDSRHDHENFGGL